MVDILGKPLESIHFNHIFIAFFQICYGGVQRQTFGWDCMHLGIWEDDLLIHVLL